MKTVINPATGSLDVALTITIPGTEITERTVSFLFSSSAKVASISGEQLKDYDVNEAAPGMNIYTIQFNSDIYLSTTIRFEYSLTIPADHPINRISDDWIELNIDSFWHPVFTSIPRFHFLVKLNLDNDFQILTGDHFCVSADNPKLRVIQSSRPRVDISFSATRHLYSREGKLSQVISSNETTNPDSLLHLAEQSLAFLHNYTDRSEDFASKRIIIESPRKESGYARENYIVLSNVKGMDPVHLSRFLTHEFSHYWFSNANPNSPDYWIDEAFAEILAMIFLRETFGEETFENDLKNKLERAKLNPSPISSYNGRPSYIALYYKGPLVLHYFEEYLGRDNFQLFIRNVIASKTSTQGELMALIEKQLGPEAANKMDKLINTGFHN